MEETRKFGNVATRVRTVHSCFDCPWLASEALRVVCAYHEDRPVKLDRRLADDLAGVPAACPMRGESVLVALSASAVIS